MATCIVLYNQFDKSKQILDQLLFSLKLIRVWIGPNPGVQLTKNDDTGKPVLKSIL